MQTTIYHNPKCGTSRNVLAMLQAAGDVQVVEYLKEGWSKTQLEGLIRSIGCRAYDLLRTKEPMASELALSENSDDAEIIAAMIAHPVLVNRPIVITPKGAKLCRPAQIAASLLDSDVAIVADGSACSI